MPKTLRRRKRRPELEARLNRARLRRQKAIAELPEEMKRLRVLSNVVVVALPLLLIGIIVVLALVLAIHV